MRRMAVRSLRVVFLSLRDFFNDRCGLRASALTFFSLLSIVPTAAVAFGIAQGFGLDKRLEALLYEQLAGQEEVAQRIVEFSRSLLENTRGGLIAGIGVLILLWTVLKLLSHIEQAFNEIWQVPRGRTLIRKFADYIAIMFVCPILLLVASSTTVLVASRLEALVEQIDLLTHFGPAILLSLKLLPFVSVWILFTFVYLIMPNTKVRFLPAVGGGIIAGSAYQLLQELLVNAQIGVSQYNAIYGSFAALPLFLIWLQLSWIIVLLGAEFAYACQYASSFEFEPDYKNASLELRCLVALRIVHYCVQRFSAAATPPSEAEIAGAIAVPPRVIAELINRLMEAGVISRVKHHSGTGYQPGYDTGKLTVHSVISALIKQGSNSMPGSGSKDLDKLQKILSRFNNELLSSSANQLVKAV